MANSIAYIAAAVCFAIVIVIFLIALLQNSVDERRLLATPTIPIEKAILTSVASTIIHAKVDEVFSVLTRFEEYPEWSSFKNYKWKETAPDGVPLVGSRGKVELHLEGFGPKTLPVRLTLLDRTNKILTERSIGYPSWLLSSERVQEVIPVDGHNDLCEYRTWHTIEGICGYFLLITAQDELTLALRDTANNLKTLMEER